jgi:hypothetical protein
MMMNVSVSVSVSVLGFGFGFGISFVGFWFRFPFRLSSLDRSLCSGDNGEYEDESLTVAEKIQKRLGDSAPVVMVRSGPSELRCVG